MTAPPLAFRWTGENFCPLKPKRADEVYVVGQVYWLEEASERSWASHQHQFAWIAEAWKTLPEQITDAFPSPEHLRKAALIATGWRRETVFEAGGKAAALRFAAYVRGEDEFAHVIIRGPTVIVRKARSQRMHGHDRMTKSEFQQSKDAILGWISQLIGVDPEALSKVVA